MLEQLILGYEQAFADQPDVDISDGQPAAVAASLASAFKRKWKHLAQERIRDTRPTIPLSKSFLALSKEERMDDQARLIWQKELNRNGPKNLDAPGWLWTSVVELLAHHEKAYLEHCRKYALALDKV